MPDHKGYRAKSRHVFRKKIHGMPKPTKFLQVYKLGDYVTIKMDSAIHGGMAHRIYQGKTGVVWNITHRSVGVLLKKKLAIDIEPKDYMFELSMSLHLDVGRISFKDVNLIQIMPNNTKKIQKNIQGEI
eukprot:UN00769